VLYQCALHHGKEKVVAGYQDNEEDKKLLAALSLPSEHPKGFALVEGLIRYKSRIRLGHNRLAQQHVLQALHVSDIGGHSGIQSTYQRVKILVCLAQDEAHNHILCSGMHRVSAGED
jgi:hypothetical protein